MTMKVTNDEGVEVEVYTADEMKAASEAAVQAKEKEFTPIKTKLETDLADATKALGERAGEFKQFRKLNDDVVVKLSVAERTIYENGLALQEAREKDEKRTKDDNARLVDTAIRAKVGTDEKLFTKVKDMYSLIGIEATTPEAVERKVLATLGAIGTTEPDLVASVAGFSGGSYIPPVVKKEGEGSFADTEQGKRGAVELGLKLEADKK